MKLIQRVRMIALMARNKDENIKRKLAENKRRRDKALEEAEDREIEDVNSWMQD